MNCVKEFENIYKKEPEGVTFCSYRVCPLGAHIDHQLGKVTGLAIDKGVYIAYTPTNNGIVELSSLQFEGRIQFHLHFVSKEKQCDWADYLRGATIALSKKYHLNVGVHAVIEGTLPIGGLSSSAAVTIAFITALCKVNNIMPTNQELIALAMEAENRYVGVSCGKLDQSCEILSKKDHLLYLDTLDDTYELIPTHKDMKPYKLAIFFSGLERSLVGSKYNSRIDECRSTAYALKSFIGEECGKVSETQLRDVPREVFDKYKNKLPEVWVKRAEHYYSEYDRVEAGAEAWRRGDLEAFGKLCFESGYSSIYNWETGCPELIELYNILTKTDGVYGGRFSGAGFKGCSMAIIDPSMEEYVIKTVSDKYLKAFPHLKGKYSFSICESADGVSIGKI
ncbi:MAG: GHMP kinase [Clostridiales bacterium]|nr:GHMP kinase [Clostridiales bacterium]